MKTIVVISVLLVASASYAQIRAQSSKADSKKPDSKKKAKSQNEADKIADKILGDQDVPSWYGDVYPALKRKYDKPVSRELYDAWRERYWHNEVAPHVLKDGYGLEPARQQFMKQTEKQPSN